MSEWDSPPESIHFNLPGLTHCNVRISTLQSRNIWWKKIFFSGNLVLLMVNIIIITQVVFWHWERSWLPAAHSSSALSCPSITFLTFNLPEHHFSFWEVKSASPTLRSTSQNETKVGTVASVWLVDWPTRWSLFSLIGYWCRSSIFQRNIAQQCARLQCKCIGETVDFEVDTEERDG